MKGLKNKIALLLFVFLGMCLQTQASFKKAGRVAVSKNLKDGTTDFTFVNLPTSHHQNSELDSEAVEIEENEETETTSQKVKTFHKYSNVLNYHLQYKSLCIAKEFDESLLVHQPIFYAKRYILFSVFRI